MKLLYPLIILFACSTEPEDCAGVAGGTATFDDCGVCGGDNSCQISYITSLIGEWEIGEIIKQDTLNGVAAGLSNLNLPLISTFEIIDEDIVHSIPFGMISYALTIGLDKMTIWLSIVPFSSDKNCGVNSIRSDTKRVM